MYGVTGNIKCNKHFFHEDFSKGIFFQVRYIYILNIEILVSNFTLFNIGKRNSMN